MGLARALSKLGLLSRRQAIDAILAGRVAVDGRVVRDPGLPVRPETAAITIDAEQAPAPARLVYLLHKPRGVVTTRSDPQGRPTVYDLLPAGLPETLARRQAVATPPAPAGDEPVGGLRPDTHGAGPWLAPVGRLDFASSGLLLLTNDTALADWLTNPANVVPRTYLVTVRGRLGADTARRAEAGLEVAGERGPERLAAQSVQVRKQSGRESHLVVILAGGRNREIRRLFLALGHEVTRLIRVALGGLGLGSLPPGAGRIVSDEEIARLFPAAPHGLVARRGRHPR